MPVLQKKFKLEMKRDQADMLMHMLDNMIEITELKDDDDKLLFACLAEISLLIYNRLGTNNISFKIKLSPSQAIALRLLYTGYVNNPTTYLGNILFGVSNRVHKEFF